MPEKEPDQLSLENVPKGISFGRLVYPPTKSEIILVGVKRRALLHSSFVHDLLFDMAPECTLLQLPPDLPMFIRPTGESDKDYRGEWFQFLRRGKDSYFYVNPYPKFTSDIVLTKKRVQSLIRNSILPANDQFELGPKAIYSEAEPRCGTTKLVPDTLLTPLLYSFNTRTGGETNPQVMAVGDMPLLIQKDL